MAKLERAGGLVGVGSHGEMQGIGYHWEMWMLASGGMTPLEVIRCATCQRFEDYRQAPRTLARSSLGNSQNLVIMDKNPPRGHPQHQHDSLGNEKWRAV